MRNSETTERFHFVISITGLIRPNNGKADDDHKKQIYLLLKALYSILNHNTIICFKIFES
jgi:hypothetical protein